MLYDYYTHTGLCQGGGSCVQSVWLSPEKQFAFLELRSHQEGQRPTVIRVGVVVGVGAGVSGCVCSPLGHVWLVRACVRVQRERVCSDSPILYLYICPLHSNTQSLSLSLSLSLSHTHLLRACVMKSYARLCGRRAPKCGGLNMQREKRDYFY